MAASPIFFFPSRNLWHSKRFEFLCASPNPENFVGRGFFGGAGSIDLRRAFSGLRANRARKYGALAPRSGRCAGECAARSETCNLGRESTPLQTISLRRRPRFFHRQGLRLFGDSFLCTWRGRTDSIAHELVRFPALRPERPRQMDNRLRTERSHLCGYCGPSFGHHSFCNRARALGAGLATYAAHAVRLRRATSDWIVTSKFAERR